MNGRIIETNLKFIILSATDDLINQTTNRIDSRFNQDEPFTVDVENEIKDFQHELLELYKFRKSFAAEINYDSLVLQKIVSQIIIKQRH